MGPGYFAAVAANQKINKATPDESNNASLGVKVVPICLPNASTTKTIKLIPPDQEYYNPKFFFKEAKLGLSTLMINACKNIEQERWFELMQ